MKPWWGITDQNGDFKHAARALLSAISIVIINNVAGPTETSGIVEVAKRWTSGLQRFFLGISDSKF